MAPLMRTKILGIVNITRDSFSDGAQFIESAAAIAHAQALLAAGADIIDLGAQSTHPDAEAVPAEEEIRRLLPVISALKHQSARVSVDTFNAEVMRAAIHAGADVINDVTGFRDPDQRDAVRTSDAKLIVMHSVSSSPRAERIDVPADQVVERVREFFALRISELYNAGIDRSRLILDPGMGYFAGTNPSCSLRLLRALSELREFGAICVSTSRKSFIGAVLANAHGPRPVTQRAAGTLATEIWAALQNVEYIRTHDVAPLHDALTMLDAIRECRDDPPLH
jgi:dihydropteroate synthase type 2